MLSGSFGATGCANVAEHSLLRFLHGPGPEAPRESTIYRVKVVFLCLLSRPLLPRRAEEQKNESCTLGDSRVLGQAVGQGLLVNGSTDARDLSFA